MPGHLIRRLNQRSAAVFQDRIRALEHDMTSVQFAALVTLLHNPGIDQAGLAGMIAYDRATMGGVVKRLEQKGLIKRQVDENDRRARSLQLTDAGKAAVTKMAPVVTGFQNDILANLSDEEKATLLSLIEKAIGA